MIFFNRALKFINLKMVQFGFGSKNRSVTDTENPSIVSHNYKYLAKKFHHSIWSQQPNIVATNLDPSSKSFKDSILKYFNPDYITIHTEIIPCTSHYEYKVMLTLSITNNYSDLFMDYHTSFRKSRDFRCQTQKEFTESSNILFREMVSESESILFHRYKLHIHQMLKCFKDSSTDEFIESFNIDSVHLK